MEEKTFAFRSIAYQEEDGSFTGVCLDLDIVEEGHATLQEAILSINDAVASHLHSVARLGFPKELINRPAPKDYWKKLEEMAQIKPVKFQNSPFQFYNSPQHVCI